MANSERLRLRDVRRVYRLLEECRELGADAIAWRRHMAERLPALFGGQIGQIFEVQIVATPFGDPFWLRPLFLTDFGWATPGDRKALESHLATGRPEDGPHITPDLLQRRVKTVHWSGNPDRSNWQESMFFNEYVKTGHLDDGIFAHHLVEKGRMRWMFVIRALGERPFRRRECRLMALLNAELARTPDTKLAPVGKPCVAGLPRRLRDVLICLMDGDSEKQAALRLEISRHTVHDYVKQLHERFGVNSRGELLSRCRLYWPVLEWLEAANGDGRAE